MSPMDANTFKKVIGLRSDNFSTEEFWILTDILTVTLAKQKNGEPSTQKITMPRAEFNRLIRWYIRDQKKTKK